MAQAKQYEPGMRIAYDPQSKRVRVAFRGRLTELNGTFENERDAIRAGEEHCRRTSWTIDRRRIPPQA